MTGSRAAVRQELRIINAAIGQFRSWSRWSRVVGGVAVVAIVAASIRACPAAIRNADLTRRTFAAMLMQEIAFSNGSFEAGLDGWTVEGPIGVRTGDAVRPAADGSTVVVLNANDESSADASLSQMFTTRIGQRYGVSFDFGAVGGVADQVLNVRVAAGDRALVDKTVSVSGLNGDPFYVRQRLSFVANSRTTTLTFTDKSYTYVVIDGLFDNVTVTEEAADLPMVVADPARAAVSEGHTATFEVQASGPGPLTYRWQFDGRDIPGATDRELHVLATDHGKAGNYAVVVGNAAGSVTSSSATLTILPPGTLLNGSFEYGSAAWTFSGPEAWNASVSTNPRYGLTDGSQLVHFNWGQHEPEGSVSQTFPTTPGREYRVSFDVGAFSTVNRDEQRMRVTVRGSGLLASHEAVVRAPGTGGRYQRQTVVFVADSTETTVMFQDTSRATMNVDLLLDDVEVVEVNDGTR